MVTSHPLNTAGLHTSWLGAELRRALSVRATASRAAVLQPAAIVAAAAFAHRGDRPPASDRGGGYLARRPDHRRFRAAASPPPRMPATSRATDGAAAPGRVFRTVAPDHREPAMVCASAQAVPAPRRRPATTFSRSAAGQSGRRWPALHDRHQRQRGSDRSCWPAAPPSALPPISSRSASVDSRPELGHFRGPVGLVDLVDLALLGQDLLVKLEHRVLIALISPRSDRSSRRWRGCFAGGRPRAVFDRRDFAVQLLFLELEGRATAARSSRWLRGRSVLAAKI